MCQAYSACLANYAALASMSPASSADHRASLIRGFELLHPGPTVSRSEALQKALAASCSQAVQLMNRVLQAGSRAELRSIEAGLDGLLQKQQAIEKDLALVQGSQQELMQLRQETGALESLLHRLRLTLAHAPACLANLHEQEQCPA